MQTVDDAAVSTFEDRLKRWQAGLDFTKSMVIVALVLAFVVYPNALWYVFERGRTVAE